MTGKTNAAAAGLSGAALIYCAFPTDATYVSCTNGTRTYTVPEKWLSSGGYCFAVHAVGEWTLTAKKGTIISPTKSVTAEAGKAYSVTLSFRTFLFTANNQYTELTGGWESGGDTGSATIVMKDRLSITINSAQRGAYVYTKNRIDLRPYRQIRFKGYSADPNYAAFGASTRLAQNMGYDPGSTYTSYFRPPTASADKLLDISSLADPNGYYIVISAFQGSSHNSAPAVYEVELIE